MSKTTLQYVHGFHAVEALLKYQPQAVMHVYILKQRHDMRMKNIMDLALRHHCQVTKVSREELVVMAGEQHQGVIAKITELSRYLEKDLSAIVENAANNSMVLVLDQVQDPHNVGACLRSANAFGVDAVIVPQHHACALTSVARKAASGADMITPYIQVTNLARTLRWLKEQHYWLVGLDGQAEQTLLTIDLTGKIVFVMGNEGEGLRRLTREHCDYIVRIEMQGIVESLNVSVATAICLYSKYNYSQM